MKSKIGGSTKFCDSDSISCLQNLKVLDYDFAELIMERSIKEKNHLVWENERK